MVLGPDFNLHLECSASLQYHRADKSKNFVLTVFSCIILMLIICSSLRFEEIALNQKISSLQGGFPSHLSPSENSPKLCFPLAFSCTVPTVR